MQPPKTNSCSSLAHGYKCTTLRHSTATQKLTPALPYLTGTDVLRVLRRALPRRSLHHHHPPQDAVLPLQHHLPLPLAHHPQPPRLLAASGLRREDHPGYHRAAGVLRLHAAHRRVHAGHLGVRAAYRSVCGRCMVSVGPNTRKVV